MSLNHIITKPYISTLTTSEFLVTAKETLYTESNSTLRIECILSANSTSPVNTTSWFITLPAGYQMPALTPSVTGTFQLRNRTAGVPGTTFLMTNLVVTNPTTINFTATSESTISINNIYFGYISVLISEFVRA